MQNSQFVNKTIIPGLACIVLEMLTHIQLNCELHRIVAELCVFICLFHELKSLPILIKLNTSIPGLKITPEYPPRTHCKVSVTLEIGVLVVFIFSN